MHTPSVATLREGQRCRATGGRNPMDWVATFLWIEWQLCRGLGGNFPADWVAEFRGIRSEDGKQQARSGRREDERDTESSRWTTWCCRERFVHLHFHILFLEGVYVDRIEASLKPRFVQGEPPTDTAIAAVVQKISRRAIRTLRHLGYLESG